MNKVSVFKNVFLSPESSFFRKPPYRRHLLFMHLNICAQPRRGLQIGGFAVNKLTFIFNKSRFINSKTSNLKTHFWKF